MMPATLMTRLHPDLNPLLQAGEDQGVFCSLAPVLGGEGRGEGVGHPTPIFVSSRTPTRLCGNDENRGFFS
jgi:hypothetical protein